MGVVSIDDPAVIAKAAAEERRDSIVRDYSSALKTYFKAVEENDWIILGFVNMEEWQKDLTSRIGRKFDAVTRKKLVSMLTATGKTVREISAATGAGVATVSRDQQEAAAEASSSVPDGTEPAATPTPASPRQEASRQREKNRRQPEHKIPVPANVPGDIARQAQDWDDAERARMFSPSGSAMAGMLGAAAAVLQPRPESEAKPADEPEPEPELKERYRLVSEFDTRESAELAATEIMKLQGIINVRYY